MSAEPTPAETLLQKSLPQCPCGKADCAIIAELVELRQTLAELAEQVRTDPLTGLANYRSFSHALEQELERTQRGGQPTTLIMLDIDFFKKVNDTWGHEVGNQALAHVGRLLKQAVRRLDRPCRYGGEEFAVILPNTDLAAGIPVAERLRQTIAENPLPIDNHRIDLTVSLGVATYELGELADVDNLVQRADHYLYQAKQEGRNRVRHAALPPVDLVSREEREVLSHLFGGENSAAEKPGSTDNEDKGEG